LYVYIGSLAGSLASLGTEGRARTPAEWTFYAVGLVNGHSDLYVTRRQGCSPGFVGKISVDTMVAKRLEALVLLDICCYHHKYRRAVRFWKKSFMLSVEML